MATPITPNTSVYLLKCPLEMDNSHQMNFASKEAQFNYFNSLPKIEFDKFSYQRQDGVLRINEHIDNLLEYTYVMYQNENYTDKWFYAFITGMEYINDNCTFVSIKTDVFQTWWFDLQFKECFIEREHVNDDTFGAHTLEENIPTGEFISNSNDTYGFANPKDYVIVIEVSELLDQMKSTFGNSGRYFNGLPSGVWKIIIDVPASAPDNEKFRSLNQFILCYDQYGKGDSIINMYIIPKELVDMETASQYDIEIQYDVTVTYSFTVWIIDSTDSAVTLGQKVITRNTTIDGYTPKNNKLFTRQFNYLMASNNNGANVTYNYEDFATNPTFYLACIYEQGCQAMIYPHQYKNTLNLYGNQWGIQLTELPIVSWKSDYFLNWQAKQGWNNVSNQAYEYGNMLESGSKMPTGGDKLAEAQYVYGDVLGGFIGGAIDTGRAIVNTLSGAMSEASRTPDPVHNTANYGSLVFSMNVNKIFFYKMSIKHEVAKIVDDYFSAYGYKVAAYKLPNLTGRRNWNYLKITEPNIIGEIPQTDMAEIKQIFQRGVTIWHNSSTFLDYTQNNDIV